jgi:hypothetical protein
MARGGSGVVTLNGVGPLRFGVSSAADVRVFAGAPDSIGHVVGGKDWFYKFAGGRTAQYYMVNPHGTWVVGGFETNLPRFHTAHGTRPGDSLQEAEHQEGIGKVSSECGAPALLRTTGKGLHARVLGLWIIHSRVSGLFAMGPDPFGFC